MTFANASRSACYAATLAAMTATAAFADSDTFNRATLGSDWTVAAGSLTISADQLIGTTGSIGVQKSSRKEDAVSATFRTHGTDLEYGALTLGKLSTGANAFVKLQAQTGDGTFSNAAFYTANNSGGSFFALTSPVPSPAIVDVSFCGTVAQLRITSAAGVQNYTYDYGFTFGSGAGVGTYGAISIDNFIPFTGGCGAATAGGTRILRSSAVDRTLAK